MTTSRSVALVTGAGNGIGYAIAETLLEAGRSVLILDIKADDARAAGAKLGERFPGEVAVAIGSVTSSKDFGHAFDVAEAELGPVDVLVNNAGWTGFSPIVDLDEQEWTDVMAVLTTGPFLGTKILARRVGIMER